jgi:hypothetical protein
MKIYLFIFCSLFFISPEAICQEMNNNVAEQMAQEQLDAYNSRDIDRFLEPYAEDVQVYAFPSQFLYEGKSRMRERYASFFERTPDLHCQVVNRMILGNTVIDQEEVTLRKGEPAMHAIAIYKIKDGKIAEVFFITNE